MAKEVFDNEKLKKVEKTGEGIYSEEACNVFKAKTLEEYIAICDVEIQKVKDKIEENEKAVKESKEQLNDVDTGKFVEKYAVKRLSKILSIVEMKTIKKGRKWEDLRSIVKEGHDDPYRSLIEKIYKGIKELSDEDRLIIAEYLGNKQIILVDSDQYRVKDGTSCCVGWYYTDLELHLDEAREVQRNLDRLGLEKYVKYVGDSCYRVDDEFRGKVREKARKETSSDVQNLNKENFERLTNEGKILNEMLESLEERKSAVEKYGLPENEAISLYQWSKELYRVHDEFYDKENHTLVVLHEYSDYNGSGGTEYGTVISIKRGKNTTKKSFKYRDRYDYRNDNPKYHYNEIKNVRVDGDKVEVTVSSSITDTYTFDIAYDEDKSILSSVEKKKFEESIRSVKEGLIVENTKDKKYPASYNLALRKVPGSFDKDGMNLESELSYDKAKVVYENIIPEKGEAHVTILTQSDASGDMGRQFALIKYIVTPKGAKKVDEYFYWEWNLMDKEVQNKMNEFSNW